MSLIYIALGGGLGAVSRFLLTEHINNNISDLFPFGTLSVNILGCFVVGCVAGFFASKSSPIYIFFVIGFLGSFTTMSAFSIQTIDLFNSNSIRVNFASFLAGYIDYYERKKSFFLLAKSISCSGMRFFVNTFDFFDRIVSINLCSI